MTAREHELETMLEDLRDRILDARRARVHEMHEKGEGEAGSVTDSLDRAENDLVDDVEAALLQMATETLAKIDEALTRLDAGTYGICVDCRGHIPLARLNALPFAVRCRACEERRDAHDSRGRPPIPPRGPVLEAHPGDRRGTTEARP